MLGRFQAFDVEPEDLHIRGRRHFFFPPWTQGEPVDWQNWHAEVSEPLHELGFLLGVDEDTCVRATDDLIAMGLVVDWGECNFVLSAQGEAVYAALRTQVTQDPNRFR